jgi:hypothetical protein
LERSAKPLGEARRLTGAAAGWLALERSIFAPSS